MLIILDRDGVINKDSYAYIRRAHEWTPIEGSIEAIARLSQSGHQIAIATNQSGVGRGYFSEQHLAEIHHKMQVQIEQAGGVLSHIAFCPTTRMKVAAVESLKVGCYTKLQIS